VAAVTGSAEAQVTVCVPSARRLEARAMQGQTAFYSGSFDPVTNGHLDVIEGALRIAARVVVAVGAHPGKHGMFDVDERLAMIRQAVSELQEGVRVEAVSFDGLAVDAARGAGAGVIVRGVRDGTDLDYEMQMVGMNAAMAPLIRTVLIPASASTRMITGTLVRQIAAMGGNVRPFVPALVAQALEARFAAERGEANRTGDRR
jgi:pantetheine-phosphate adenylyltransferase